MPLNICCNPLLEQLISRGREQTDLTLHLSIWWELRHDPESYSKHTEKEHAVNA